MDPVYFDHAMKLVLGVYLLCTDIISEASLVTAEKLLVSFVSQFQALYDARYLPMNLHLLLHLPQTVRNSGSLYNLSCFAMEDINGKSIKNIHGSTHTGLQVYSAVAHGIMLPYLISKLPDDSEAKAFSVRLLGFKKKQRLFRIAPKTFIVGKISRCAQIPALVRDALDLSFVTYRKVSLFKKLKCDNQLYSSLSARQTSRVAHYVVYEYEEHNKRFGVIKTFVRTCECATRACDNDEYITQHFALIQEGEVQPCFYASPSLFLGDSETPVETVAFPYFHKFLPEENVKLESIETLRKVCFVIEAGANIFVAEPVNLIETE